uniref:50S ribosomal protein L23 n=1 Tax=Gymnochlora stellata TaxID=67809 RepID=A0A140JZF4_GYMST|nr:50S ribosomal protein L23 [Gymnochlora stellata]BAU62481.1 50S ribosomal protein L23 [Gymnochlora stellata]
MINLIKFQLLTEKSLLFLENNKYTFQVDSKLNKLQIKNIFETLFNIKVLKVNTCRCINKVSRSSKNYKKVIITIESDKVINFS